MVKISTAIRKVSDHGLGSQATFQTFQDYLSFLFCLLHQTSIYNTVIIYIHHAFLNLYPPPLLFSEIYFTIFIYADRRRRL